MENTDRRDALESLEQIKGAISIAISHASEPVMETVFKEDVLLYLRKSLHDISVGIDVQISSIKLCSHELNSHEKEQAREETSVEAGKRTLSDPS